MAEGETAAEVRGAQFHQHVQKIGRIVRLFI